MNDVVEKLIDLCRFYGTDYSTDTCFRTITTIKCGGKIALTVEPRRVIQACAIYSALQKYGVRHIVLGMGSNVVASEKDYDGVVLNMRRLTGCRVRGNSVVALGGTSTAAVFDALQKHSLTKGEFLGCIPATIGGAAVMNAGCYGQCMSDIVSEVLVLKEGKLTVLKNSQCNFAKRHSNLDNCLVVAVKLQLPFGDNVQQRAEEMRRAKRLSQPLNFPSAGSALYCADGKCIPSLEADKCGFKGVRLGGAKVSEKHAGFVLNVDKARGEDIYLLVSIIKETLKKKTGSDIRTEIKFVGMP